MDAIKTSMQLSVCTFGSTFLWKRNQQFTDCDFTCQNRLKWMSEIKDAVEWAPMTLPHLLAFRNQKPILFCTFYFEWLKIRSIQWEMRFFLWLRFIFNNYVRSFWLNFVYFMFIFFFSFVTAPHISWAEMQTSIYSWTTQHDDSPISYQEIGHGTKLKLNSRQHIKSYLCQSSIIMWVGI